MTKKLIAKEDKGMCWNQNNPDPHSTPPAVRVDNRTAVSIANTPHEWQHEDLCQCQSFLLMLKHSSWCEILSAQEITSLTLPYQVQETKMSSFAKRWWRNPSPPETHSQYCSQQQAARLKCSSKFRSPNVWNYSISSICSHCTHFKGTVKHFKSGTVLIT